MPGFLGLRHFSVTTRTGAASLTLAIGGLAALAVVFASLGAWQLRRAESSRATQAQFTSGTADEPLAALPRELDAAVRFRRVAVEGEYVAEPQFLLDNMLHDGVAGYHVVTALRVRGERERVLVNRGWVSAGGDRSRLPDVSVEPGVQTVTGRLERLPRPGMRLEGEAGGSAQLVVLQYPTAGELEEALGAPVFDYQLLLDADSAQGYVRDWHAPGVAPERHLSYAGQWLALAIGAFAAAGVMTVRSARRKA
jgi:surfeit locus 1 family protein